MKKCFSFILFSAIFPGLFLSCGKNDGKASEKAFRNYNGNYVIVISKKKFTLSVYERGKGKIESYRIGYGSSSEPGPKLYEGDNRTPEGFYQVNEILSMDSDRSSESYSKLSKMNAYFFKKVNGYHKYGKPDEDLGDNAYGPRYFGINYPNEEDSRRYNDALSKGIIPEKNGIKASIGYGIAIHGNNDEESIGHKCSSGCMRMFNRDIVELEKFISLGTPVVILKD